MTSIAIAPSTRQVKGRQRRNSHQVPSLQKGMAMPRRCVTGSAAGMIADVNWRRLFDGRGKPE